VKSTLLKSPLAPYAALGFGIVCVAFGAIFVRLAGASGPVAGFYRMAVASIVMLVPVYGRVRATGLPAGVVLKLALIAGVLSAIDTVLWATGVTLSGATNPTLLANTAPVWVGLGALLFFGERLQLGFWVGLVIALAGAVTILGLDVVREATFGLGTFLGMLAAVFFAAFLLVSQRVREHIDALTYNWTISASGAILLFALVIALRQPLTGYSTNSYLSFLGLGLIPQTLGWLAIHFALGHLSASRVAPTLLAQPVLTGLLAIPLLGERLTAGQILGGIAVLSGVFLVHRSRAPVDSQPQTASI